MPKYLNPGKIKFDAKLIDNDGSGMYVEFPHDVEETFGVKGRVPIKCSFDGIPYRGSLANMGMSCHALIVLKQIRETLNKSSGDSVHIILELDTDERKIELADDVLKILKKNSAAKSYWEKLSFSNQREYQQWIDSAKRVETRSTRINLMMEKLAAGEKLR